MRSIRLLPLFVLLALALPAFAEDEPPAVTAPSWVPSDVVLRAESLPQGWTLGADDPVGKEIEDAIRAALQKEGIEDFYAEVERVAVKDATGGQVSLVLGAIDVEPKGVNAAVQATAKEKGWTYRELTTPWRFLVSAGPDASRKAAEAAQVEYAAKRMTDLAFRRLQQGAQAPGQEGQRSAFMAAERLVRSALALDEKEGRARLVMANTLHAQAARMEDVEKFAKAAAEFEKAFANDAHDKPAGLEAYEGLSNWGLALLMQKTPEANAAAKKVLLKSLEFEKADTQGALRGNTRYNLACALSLVGDKAEAVKHFAESLVALKAAMEPEAFKKFVEKHVPGDKDLDAVRNEPGFVEAVKKASEGSDSGGV